MLFHSQIFLFIFLPTVFCIFYLTNKFTKIDSKLILILSGLIFYSWWNIYLTPLIIISIIFNFYLSKFLINKNYQSKKKNFINNNFFKYFIFNNFKIFRFSYI